MNINFTGHQVEVTDALRDLTTKKLALIQRHFENISTINITFSVEKLNQNVEGIIHLPGTSIHAKSSDENMYVAIDSLIDKLERQLKKHKEKEEGRRTTLPLVDCS
ncbi:ribosome hibernation promoting factor [soil metagenome]